MFMPLPCIFVCLPDDPLPPWMQYFAFYGDGSLESLLTILKSVGHFMV